MDIAQYLKTELLLPMNSAIVGGHPAWFDYSKNNLSVVQNGAVLPTLETSQSKFYGSSAYFPGSASARQLPRVQLTMPTAIGTNQFYIGVWVRHTSSGTNKFVTALDNRAASSWTALDAAATGHLQLGYQDNAYPAFYYGSSFTVLSNGTTTVATVDTWNHLAVSRDGSNVVRLFFNGTVIASATITNNFDRVRCTVGGVPVSFAHPTDTYLNDLQVVIGDSVYTADFTAPTRGLLGNFSGTVSESLTASAFTAKALDIKSGYTTASAAVTASAFYLDTMHPVNPVCITVQAGQGDRWRPSTAYAINDLVLPSDTITTPYYYKRLNASSSGTTEPTWPTVVGDKCNDGGTNDWECVERVIQPVVHGPIIPG